MPPYPLDERVRTSPGAPGTSPYVFVSSLKLWLPVQGADQGDGTAAMLVSGAGIAPAATTVTLKDGDSSNTLDIDGTGAAKIQNLDLAISALRDAITAAAPNAKTLADLYAQLEALKTNTDGLEGFTDGIEALLQTIRDNADTVETLLSNISGFVDGVETLLAGLESISVENFPATYPLSSSEDQILQDTKRSITDYRTLLDYDGRSDGNPVYVGKASQTALVTNTVWVIQKLFYDASARLIDAQVKSPMQWSNRADPTADGLSAWRAAGGD